MPVILIYSCTASETETTPDITFEELKTRVNKNSRELFSLDADGEISIDSPSMSNTGSITVSIIKPDSVFTKLEGPFGIDVADLLITRNNFIYYNAQENRVIRGPSTPKNLALIMRIKVSFDEIINAFSGKFSFDDEKYTEVNITTEEGKYVVVLNSESGKKRYWIDSRFYYVTKIGNYDEQDKAKFEILYSNFYEKDGIHFPKNISISRPKEKQNIWLNYYKEEFNNDKLNYRLKIPKSAKQINW
ncbi:MAG: DUF4292 domain-containing protein [Ignavibacteria bacterium]